MRSLYLTVFPLFLRKGYATINTSPYNIIHDNFLELRKEQKEKNRKFSSREFHYIRLCTLYAVVVFPVSSSLSKFKWAFSTTVLCYKKALPYSFILPYKRLPPIGKRFYIFASKASNRRRLRRNKGG